MLSKVEIRKILIEKRAQMSEAEVHEKSSAAADVFLSSGIYKNSDCIMIYMQLGNETDTSEIMKAAFRDGKKLVLPVTDPKGFEITPVLIAEDTTFAQGTFSVTEPVGAKKANISDIDVVIVPGLSFDKKGNRLGFGKGCYDKFLINANALKVGYCYDFQVLDEIPADEHDIKMDYLITEKGLVKI
ncbi:MAG: 5-formyltetrahydrofolate cyclo-ligase [Monoglobales bacterium]